MAKKLTFNQKINYIENKFREYNQTNKDIKRFGNIFNTFVVHYEINEPILIFELKSTDVDESEYSPTTFGTENWIEINFENDNEVNWLFKTFKKLVDKTNLIMKKAREFTKPNVGILTYDEFTDSYYLNPFSGPILLRSKEVAKEISTTRIDIFSVFLNLRSLVIDKDRRADIFGFKAPEIVAEIIEVSKKIKANSSKLIKIEGIPRFEIELSNSKTSDFLIYSSYITVRDNSMLDENIKINKYKMKVEKNDVIELGNLYSSIKRDEEVSQNMVNLARCLISKNDPKLYTQNSNSKEWNLTKEGRETIKDLSIIDFINNDISEIEFSID